MTVSRWRCRHSNVTSLALRAGRTIPKRVSNRSFGALRSVLILAIVFIVQPGSADPGSADAGEGPAVSSHAEPVEQIVITGRHMDPREHFVVDPSRSNPNAPDSAAMLELIPGAHVVSNGPLTGDVQIRGMWGVRSDVKVGGVSIDSAGPNRMDPPMAYAPRSLVRSVEVSRGIAPVSAGPETIGGQVRAELKSMGFAKQGDREVHFDGEVGGRSADASVGVGGVVGFATDRHRIDLIGSRDVGDDLRSPEGRVRNTEYERTVYGGGYGYRIAENHELDFRYRHTDLDDTGNPVLPMDIRFFDAEMFQSEYDGRVGEVDFHASAYFSDTDHQMDNFSLRRPPAPAMQRVIDAEAKGYGWDASAAYPLGIGRLEVGTDGYRTRHDMRVGNPTAGAFFVENFDDALRNRYGIYAEWKASPIDHLGVELGLRYTRVHTDADAIDSTPSQTLPPAMMLRNVFNAADKEESDNHFDFVARAIYDATPGLRLDLGVARKTRSPSYLERYAWLPLEVTSGLADGNNYVGDIGLNEEISWEVEGGLAWRWQAFYIAPRAFYRHVDDYIQGTPSINPNVIAVSTLNGDPTPLQFSNVEAELFGVDAEFGIELPWNFQVDGQIAYVRGKRRDVRDDLFRIAPLNGRTTLSYLGKGWSVSIEGVYQGKQSRVSRTNGESRSQSHAVMNIFGSWDIAEGLRLMIGVDNVTDNLYRPHLAGFNRVSNSSTALGQRVAGTGVNAFGRLAYRF